MAAAERSTERHGDFVDVALASGAGERAGVRELFDDIVARYGEPHRRYHTLAHAAAVADGVVVLAGASGLADARAAVLAAWLHDVVYDPRAADNEDASAAYATAALSAVGVEPGVVASCAVLVRVTATHRSATLEQAVLCDADLAILAAEPDRYRAYAQQVRQEYAWVPDVDFRLGRAAVLRALLADGPLYRTPHASAWEAAARANVTAEIAELSPIDQSRDQLPYRPTR